MLEKTIHLICNAHLDPVWQWEWEEGAATVVSTFRTAADLCDEFEEFIFCHNEAILYRWGAEYEPELFRRIQRHVEAGRWHIMVASAYTPRFRLVQLPAGQGAR